jgi:hypothetical protein
MCDGFKAILPQVPHLFRLKGLDLVTPAELAPCSIINNPSELWNFFLSETSQ